MRRRDLMLSKRLAAQFVEGLIHCPTTNWKDPEKLVANAFSMADAFVRESNRRGEGTGKKLKPQRGIGRRPINQGK